MAILLLISGGYGVKYIFDQKQEVRDAKIRQQELLASQQKEAKEFEENLKKKELVSQKKVNKYRDFEKLKKQNRDTVAWLYVPGTDINMPIVKGRDNKYYLSHDFDKKRNVMGWAFADFKNSFPKLSTNTIMYGHTYRQTTIFSKLKNVLKDNWLNNPKKHVIIFDTLEERIIFEVFSVYTLKKTNDYLYIDFSNYSDYQKYLDKSLKRSVKKFKAVPSVYDKIITISTCYTDDQHRLVVQAKRIDSR